MQAGCSDRQPGSPVSPMSSKKQVLQQNGPGGPIHLMYNKPTCFHSLDREIKGFYPYDRDPSEIDKNLKVKKKVFQVATAVSRTTYRQTLHRLDPLSTGTC